MIFLQVVPFLTVRERRRRAAEVAGHEQVLTFVRMR
jgi:hypothetical protein